MKKILLSSLLAASVLFTACAEKSSHDNSINNSIVKAVLITGSDFTSGDNFKSELPLVFNDYNNCKYLGNAKYSLSTERVYISLYQKICFDGNNIVSNNIEGFVVENRISGISTEVSYTNGIVAILKAGKNVELAISKYENNK